MPMLPVPRAIRFQPVADEVADRLVELAPASRPVQLIALSAECAGGLRAKEQRAPIAHARCATLRRLKTTSQRSTGGPDMRLATYGTLAPGRPNSGQLSDLPGRWLVGRVRGSLVDAGWGAKLGYSALILDADGSLIDVDVFESPALPRHWHRLDAFEGPGYRRVAVDVATAEGVLPASIYVLAEPPHSS